MCVSRVLVQGILGWVSRVHRPEQHEKSKVMEAPI